MATSAELQSQIDALRAKIEAQEKEQSALNTQWSALSKQLKLARQKIMQTPQPPDVAIIVEAARKLEQQLTELDAQSLAITEQIRADSTQINSLVVKQRELKDAEEEAAKTGAANTSTQNRTPTPNPEQVKPAENKVQDNNQTAPTTSQSTGQSNQSSNGATNTPSSNSVAKTDEDVFKGFKVEVNGIGNKVEQTSDTLTAIRPYNPLSKFSSYTYSISLYGITPEAYNDWNINGKWLTKDLSLLIQSGGINKALDSNRNEFFDLDFTIDDLEIITLTNAKATRFAGNQSNFKFKIYEQYGVSFLSRLVNAQVKIQEQTNIKRDIKQKIQALQCPFLIVIRFYGYDENGKLVKNLSDPNSNSYTKTDSNANFERAFPVIISKLNFKIDGRVTVYDVEAKMLNENIGYGAEKGFIKTGFDVSATDVGEAIESLMSKINKQQQELTKPPKDPKLQAAQKIADIYKITFEDKSGIADALIVNKDYYVKEYAPTARVNNKDQSNVRTSQKSTQTVSKDKRLVTVPAGSSVLTAIEAIITQSTFIKNSLDKLEKEQLQKKQPTDSDVQTPSDPLDLYWYTVRPSVKIIGYDNLRNQYAHEIIYNIIKYRIPHVQTLYLNKTLKYHGPHKIYEYYYSGNNTEILDYNASFNLAYYNIGSLATTAANAPNTNDAVRNSREPGQNADATNKLPGTNELVNSLKSYLYSPTDLLNATVTILGDPDYLMPSQAGDAEYMFKLYYGSDFTINPNSGEVFIEIGFKQAEDYDMESGTLDPQNNIVFWTYPQGSDIQKRTNGRMVYMLTQVTSRFINGIFKQELKSVIPSFIDQPKGNNSAPARTDEQKAPKREKAKPKVVQSKPPNTGELSTTQEGMKNYKSRAQTSVNDDNVMIRTQPVTAEAKGTQQELRDSAKRAEENAKRQGIQKLPWFR